MATFKYTVRDRAGRVVAGSLDGDTKEAVANKLRSMGYVIVGLDESGGILDRLNSISIGSSTKQLASDNAHGAIGKRASC